MASAHAQGFGIDGHPFDLRRFSGSQASIDPARLIHGVVDGEVLCGAELARNEPLYHYGDTIPAGDVPCAACLFKAKAVI